jgi:hypothetical protein
MKLTDWLFYYSLALSIACGLLLGKVAQLRDQRDEARWYDARTQPGIVRAVADELEKKHQRTKARKTSNASR